MQTLPPLIKLSKILSDVLNEWGISEEVTPTFTTPTNLEHGDFSSTIALEIWGKRASWPAELTRRVTNPRSLAAELAAALQLRGLPSEIIELTVAGAGFLNIRLNDSYLATLIHKNAKKDTLNLPDLGKDQIAIVEYSSPNIAKPFTIGHLRSTIIGDAVANILTATGWDVRRDNHLGDWGTQFGKQIYALLNLGKGNLQANLAELENADRPVQYLVQLYVEFHALAETKPELEDEARAWFKRLEDGDTEARKLWQLCIDYSWLEFSRIYEQLGITFTEKNGRGYGESFFEDKMAEVIKELEAANSAGTLRYEVGKDGAKLVFFANDELPSLMIMKKDGATLYATRDLATDFFRLKKYGQGVTIINEVGAEQALYFQQIYRIEQLLGWYGPSQRVHIKHGLYRFSSGKMSTRKGNVIWLDDVLKEAIQRAAKLGEGRDCSSAATAQAVGIGALKWNDLKRSSHLDVAFEWDEVLAMHGNSGPYLQYTYVRTQSLLQKAGESRSATTENELSPELPPTQRAVMRFLLDYPLTVERASREFAPHYIATYLYTLAQLFNTFYNEVPVLNAPANQRESALELIKIVADVLQEGLELLGIKTVTTM